MTNLDKWKAERIEEIEDKDIYEAICEIKDDVCMNFCVYGMKNDNGSWCTLDDTTTKVCFKGIKAYLERESEE